MKITRAWWSGLALGCWLAAGIQAASLSIQQAVELNFSTQHGVRYQLQIAPDATGPWNNQGETIVGDGSPVTKVFVSMGQARAFFRLVETGQPTLTQAKKDEINAHLSQVLAAYEIPGIVCGIKVGDAEPWFTARGFAKLDTQEPITPEHHFRIGSASKTFVAMTIMELIHEGKVHFEDTLSHYLTAEEEAALSQYDPEVITVRMLLRHTSGIANYTDNITNWFVPYIYDRTRVWDDIELLTIANQSPPYFTPGAGWAYSNSNYVLLGIIAERVTGNWIGTEIRKRFFEQLGLTQSRYPNPGESEIQAEKVAHGYMNWQNFLGGEPTVPPDLRDVTIYDPSGVGAAGPITSTVGDLVKWIYTIAHSQSRIGRLYPDNLNWLYFTGTGTDTNGVAVPFSYGMGLAHEDDDVNDANYFFIGHRGQISGYDTSMQYLPDQQTAIVVICNRSLANGPGNNPPPQTPPWPGNANDVAVYFIVNVLYPELIEATKTADSGGDPVSTAIRIRSKAGLFASGKKDPSGTFQYLPTRFPLMEYP